ncbi:MAG: hypothetical protein RLZZ308_547 [Candidatus Parcubacteria bacterium]|jgi:hypothetical protein
MKSLFWFLLYTLLSSICIAVLFPVLRITLDEVKLFGPSIWQDINYLILYFKELSQVLLSDIDNHKKNRKMLDYILISTFLVFMIMVLTLGFFEKNPEIRKRVLTSRFADFFRKWKSVMLPFMPTFALLYIVALEDELQNTYFVVSIGLCFIVSGFFSFFAFRTIQEKETKSIST